MKAAVYHGQRDIRIESVAEPTLQGPRDLIVDVTLAAVCGTDVGEYQHGPMVIPLNACHPGSGHLGPMVIGHEFMGRVSAVGSDAVGFSVGDRVVSGAGVSCGSCEWCLAGRTNLCASYYTIGLHTHGGLADRVRVPASTCIAVPESCDDLSAVLAQPLAIAIHAVARARISHADTVLVIGAGGIGSLIIAAAVTRGPRGLVAVDLNPQRLEAAARLGATATALAGERSFLDEDDGPTVVIEATGTESGLETAVAAVRRGGRILLVGMHHSPRTLDLRDLTLREVEVTTTQAHVCGVDLPQAVNDLTHGALAERVVDRVIPLDALVMDGLEPLAQERVNGKVVVALN